MRFKLDVIIVYVAGMVIKCLSLQKGVTTDLHVDKSSITALTEVEQARATIIFGKENGKVVAISLHDKVKALNEQFLPSKITFMSSKGKYVISACSGFIQIYDWERQKELLKFKTNDIGIQTPKFTELLENEKHLVIGDEQGITVLDIISKTQKIVQPTLKIGNIYSLLKLPALNKTNQSVCATASTDGVVKLW